MRIKKLVLGLMAGAALSLAAVPAKADDAPQFRCKEGETYFMNVMVSAHPYWVPVYQGFKQAAAAHGLQDRILGHAGL